MVVVRMPRPRCECDGCYAAHVPGLRMFLPIIERELLVAARRRGTYGLRAAAASAVMLLVALMLVTRGGQADGAGLGLAVFRTVTLLAFAFSLMAGVFLTADALSEERREGTLGLLFLTDLRVWDVVLGKLVVNSLGAVYAVLTVFPVMGIPLLLGGVAPGEYGRAALAILNALWLSLAAGMCISAVSVKQQKAVVGCLVFVMGLAGILPGLAMTVVPGVARGLRALLMGGLTANPGTIWAWVESLATSQSKILWMSPGYTYYLAFDANHRASPQAFWGSLGVCHALGWILLILAMLLVPRAVRGLGESNRSSAARRRWWPAWVERWRSWRRQRRLAANPVYFLAGRGAWPHVFTWTMVLLVAVNVAWITYGQARPGANPVFVRYFGNTIYFINRVWITILACQFFLDARRSGMLELILASPVSVKTIVQGQWLALKRVLAWPVFTIGVLHWVYVFEMYRIYESRYGGTNSLAFQFQAVVAAGSFVSFLADVFALSWVGMWLSLSHRRAGWAIVNTFVLVTVIPWLVLFLPDHQGIWGIPPMNFYVLRPAVWLLKDIVFVLWAWWCLRRRFRLAAAQAMGGGGGGWGRVRFLPWRGGVAGDVGSPVAAA